MSKTYIIDGVRVTAYGFKDFTQQEAQLYLDYTLDNVIIATGALRSISISLRKDSKVNIRVTSSMGATIRLTREAAS